MIIAVASTDGEKVDEHFGQANRFWIYDVSGSAHSLIMVRNVRPLSTGDRNHPFDSARMRELMEVLHDCERVYCTKIGDRPRRELEAAGITPVISTDPIASITG